MKSIYVGNLPFAFQDADLANLFQEFDGIKSAKIISDRDTGRSKGFGFVEVEDDGIAATLSNVSMAKKSMAARFV